MYEFFLNQFGRSLIINDIENDSFSTLDKSVHIKLIEAVYDKIQQDYPEALERLQFKYKNKADHKFIMVRRFLKCNFSLHDSEVDYDKAGDLHLEIVQCPLKGECEDDGIICEPKLNTNLSDRELEVLKLLVANYNNHEIADLLFISHFTVDNHKKNIYRKLKINNVGQLVDYAYKNKLVK